MVLYIEDMSVQNEVSQRVLESILCGHEGATVLGGTEGQLCSKDFVLISCLDLRAVYLHLVGGNRSREICCPRSQTTNIGSQSQGQTLGSQLSPNLCAPRTPCIPDMSVTFQPWLSLYTAKCSSFISVAVIKQAGRKQHMG